MKAFSLVLAHGVLGVLSVLAFGQSSGNRLTYLDGDDPFHPGLVHARFTTPQWVGQPGVEAVVILSIDDLRRRRNMKLTCGRSSND